MLFYYFAPLQNDTIVMSYCMQFILGDKREVHLLNDSVLPVTEKERRREGKVALALAWNMDTEIIIQFAHIQTEGAAYDVTMVSFFRGAE